MKLPQVYRHTMTGTKINRNSDFTLGNEGFITYGAMFMMMTLITMALSIVSLASLSLSNSRDEQELIKAHYAAERGARWFRTYIQQEVTSQDMASFVIEDTEYEKIYIKQDKTDAAHIMSYGVEHRSTARVHMYIKKDENHRWHIVRMKPY